MYMSFSSLWKQSNEGFTRTAYRSQRTHYVPKDELERNHSLGMAAMIMYAEQVCGLRGLSEQRRPLSPALNLPHSFSPLKSKSVQRHYFTALVIVRFLHHSVGPDRRWLSQSCLGWSWLCQWAARHSFPSLCINPEWKRMDKRCRKACLPVYRENPSLILQEGQLWAIFKWCYCCSRLN